MFDITGKTTFWVHFCPFWLKNFKTTFFKKKKKKKKQALSLSKLDDTLTSCKKI